MHSILSIAGDSFTPLLQHAFGHRWWTDRNLIITAVGCLAILPLTFRRSLGALAGGCGRATVGLAGLCGAAMRLAGVWWSATPDTCACRFAWHEKA